MNEAQKPSHPASGSSPPVAPNLLDHAFQIATECQATAIFVYYDALPREFRSPEADIGERIYYITRSRQESEKQAGEGHRFVQVPAITLTRMGQIKMAVLLSLAKGILKSGDRIVCLSGAAEKRSLDTIVVMDVGTEYELFLASEEGNLPTEGAMPAVIERVIEIAARLSTEGREGRRVGALFVLGDTERVLSMSRQLILNPFRGYPEEQRNILDPELEETVKELSTIDGAFLLRADGVIEAAGAYLKTSASEQKLRPGLGARHQAAAAITAVSSATAVTVSESTGTVTVFHGGRIITEIERATPSVPRPAQTG